ncbi:unnamed protein product [Lupinus luteus]|uniref:Glycosyltransferase n=1 Tax=Lupinus luteus TaxID=3873 RepID=A0AAV1XDV9_LUPLU
MEKSQSLKIYFLPFFAQGHLIPLVHLARLVASQAQKVTIITTPSNAKLFENIIEDDKLSGHHIHVHLIKFPSTQVGLPAAVENLVSATDNLTAGKIAMAAYLIQPELEAFLKNNPPDIFIPDIMFTWSGASAKSLGIPRLVFNPISIFDVCMIHAIKTHPEAFDDYSDGYYNIPGLPHPLTLPIKPSPGFARITESLLEGENDSHGVIVNSFADLDVEYTQYYENLTGRKVWHIGPTSLMVQKRVIDENQKHECLTWLNSKEKNSVLYICFGSQHRLSDDQLLEMADGLEASGHQFLWVVKNEEKLLQFEEKMKAEDKGMLIKGWAPQPLILNHPAVGGFLTHCGWNSMVEAISSGVPMITMPGNGDQYYNEKLVTEVHGFGAEVGAAEWSLSPFDAKKTVVSKELIEKAVKRLMDDGEEGLKIRRKATEMKDKAWKAANEGGSSHQNLTALIDHLRSLLPNGAT